jgi:hypothetical protein
MVWILIYKGRFKMNVSSFISSNVFSQWSVSSKEISWTNPFILQNTHSCCVCSQLPSRLPPQLFSCIKWCPNIPLSLVVLNYNRNHKYEYNHICIYKIIIITIVITFFPVITIVIIIFPMYTIIIIFFFYEYECNCNFFLWLLLEIVAP